MKNIITWKCSKCKKVKSVDEFSKNGSCKKGFRSRCKSCQADDDSFYYERKYTYKIGRHGIQLRKGKYYHKYKITQQDYDNMYYVQEGKCAICRKTFEILQVDHSHKTGKVRGLLCRHCNQGIGFLREDLLILKNAIRYILDKK